jgi:hypothetical protein
MTDPINEIELHDLSFFGGCSAKLKRNAESTVRRVFIKKSMKERRFRFIPHEDFFKNLDTILQTHNFFALAEQPTRPGVPDEAHPKITITLASGKTKTVWKWINDKVPDFDPIYNAILDYIKAVDSSIKPKYDGNFDANYLDQ